MLFYRLITISSCFFFLNQLHQTKAQLIDFNLNEFLPQTTIMQQQQGFQINDDNIFFQPIIVEPTGPEQGIQSGKRE